MYRKLAISAMVVAALAAIAAVPSVASAAELYSGTTKVPVGTEIIGTNIGNFEFQTLEGNIDCSNSQFHAQLTENGPKRVQTKITSLTITGIGAEGACTTSFLGDFKVSWELPSCTNTIATNTFTIGGCKVSESNKLNVISSLAGACHYHNGALNFSSTTKEPMILTSGSGEFSKDAGGALCWSSFTVGAHYEVKTASGGGLHMQ